MFCENCGTKITNDEKYCGNCGAKVVIGADEAESVKHKSFTDTNINNKWWFRLVKVFYILAYALIILIIIGVGYSSKSGGSLDTDKSDIHCDNGKDYNPQKNNIYLFSDYISPSDDQNIRILCAYDTLNFYSYTAPVSKNYTFEAIMKPVDWSPSFEIWFWGILITIIVFELVKRTFFYVVVGRRFFGK